MKLAIECPTKLLEQVQPLANFDWILAHKASQDTDYVNSYMKSRRLKVLDNGVCELREPIDTDTLVILAKGLNVDFVVPPDYLGDAARTLDALALMCDKINARKVFPVVQGSSVGIAIDCGRTIAQRGFDRVAIPILRGEPLTKMAQKRAEIVKSLAGYFQWIHLLGMTNFEEFQEYAGLPQVISIDTGAPVMYGLRGQRFGEFELEDKTTPTFNLMEADEDSTPSSPVLETIYYNIAFLRRFCD